MPITRGFDGNGPIIKITKEDVFSASKSLICLSLEKKLWVRAGLPVEESGKFSDEMLEDLDGPPLVFLTKNLHVVDLLHPDGVDISDAMVIFMHGGRVEGGEWKFSQLEGPRSYGVKETVDALDGYCERQGLRKVEMVIACNEKTPNPLGIKVKDLNHRPIAQAVGDVLYFGGATKDRGKVDFNIRCEGRIWGLDSLILSRKIRVEK
jgi:hypothetical protein